MPLYMAYARPRRRFHGFVKRERHSDLRLLGVQLGVNSVGLSFDLNLWWVDLGFVVTWRP